MWKYLYLLLFPIITLGQEPAHNVIGRDELEDVFISSIIQDNRANIWLSTSNGLYKYNGYEFKEIYADNIVNKSFYGLTTDNHDQIFCYNKSGQILTVDQDTVYVKYTLPDSLYGNFYYIAFDNLNNLIVSGKDFYKISNGSIQTILNQDSFHEHPMLKKPNGTLEFYSNLDHDLYHYRDNKLTRQHVDLNFGVSGFYCSIESNHHEYLVADGSSVVYKRNKKKFEKIDTGIDKATGCWIFTDRDDDIWTLSNQKGVYFHTTNEKLFQFNHKQLFPSYTFTCKLEDRDGNIWLGTFGKGLVQISNKENQIINNASLPNNDELKCISKNNEGDILIGSISGKIYEYDNNEIKVVDSVLNRIDGIEHNALNNRFYFNRVSYDYRKKEYDETPYTAIRNIAINKDSISVITAYTRVFIQDHTNDKRHEVDLDEFGFPKSEFGYAIAVNRIQSATYDPHNKTIWIGGTKKLKLITKDGEHEFMLNKRSIVALDMFWVDHLLYISTINEGLLIFKNNTLIKRIREKDGLISSTINSIKRQGDKLYFASKFGLQEMNIDNFSFRNFKNANGRQLKIKDFEIKNDVAYVLLSRGLQTIQLNSQNQKISPPIIDFTSILVNKKEHLLHPFASVPYNRNSILFEFAAKTYNNREQLIYKYQIIGSESGWEELPFNENSISVNGLDHGDYTLCLYALDSQNQKSNVLYYSFSINQPIWRVWWFYVLISAIAIGFVILFYRRRLKIQQKKSDQQNELNASRLTAIQSQMNPHFIFNSLNSIQDLVMQGDTENSYTFITKFANLVRKTLNYSDKEFIEFEQEIQLLELYLSLERLRFSNNFEYKITTRDITDILIPPMLIQPFIENALVHGLLHKEGIKKIDINFELRETLTCSITDNGVGRKKAKEIKERRKSKHESFAVRAIEKRLDILEKKFDSKFGFEYIDLMKGGKAIGTTVVIKIPIKHLF
ncbi:MAG: histidine kinase [Crocinitomicaceae bacterium]|nr:histidine kinase [Crocinitomicaceae bacterium]